MNPVSWFEVPVRDMARAVRFYNTVLNWELKPLTIGPLQMAWLPMKENEYGTAGALIRNDNYTPQTDGVLIYFHCDDVAAVLEKVNTAGGKVLLAKKPVSPEFGYMGVALDSEGNRIAFHSHS